MRSFATPSNARRLGGRAALLLFALAALLAPAAALAQGRPDIQWMRGGQTEESLQTTYSPDGQYVAMFVHPGSGADLRIYRASDGMMLRTIHVATSDAYSFAFTPDSQTIVVGAADALTWPAVSWSLKYVRVSDGVITQTVPLNWAVARLAVSPNGQYIGISDGNHTNGLWRFSDGAFLRHFATYYGGSGFAFSPDSQYVVASTMNPANFQQTLALYTVAGSTGDQPVKLIRGVGNVEFSPNGQLLAVTNGGGFSVFNMSCEPACTPPFQNSGGGVLNATFSPDGQKLAASMVHGAGTEVARVYNTSNWSVIRSFNNPRTTLPWVSFAPDSEKLLIGEIEPNIWNANTGALVLRLGYFQHRTVTVALSSDGQTLATGNTPGAHRNKIQLFNAADGSLQNVDFQQSLSRNISNIGFADNNQKIITTATSGTYSIWNAADGSLISDNFVTPSDLTLKISPDGQHFVIGSMSAFINPRLYRVSDNTLLRTFIAYGGPDVPLALSPDGQTLATRYGSSSTVRIWRVSDATVIRDFTDGEANSTHGAFSPDGQYFAAGRWNNAQLADVKLWRVSDGALVRTMTGHVNRIESVAFAPDGRTIISSATDNTLRFWRTSDGTLLRTFDQETRFQAANAGQIVYTPDGQTFAYGRADASVVVALNPYAPALVTLAPIADAYVRGATPTANYGTVTELQVKRTYTPGNGKGRQTYMRFDTSTVTGTITRAKLRVYARLSAVTQANANIPLAVFPVSTAWDELTLTWANKPAPNVPAELARVIVTDATARWYEFDITNFINQERAAGRAVTGVLLRNMLRGDVGDYFTAVNSREAASNQPQLVIEQ